MGKHPCFKTKGLVLVQMLESNSVEVADLMEADLATLCRSVDMGIERVPA